MMNKPLAEELRDLAWFLCIQRNDEAGIRRCISTAYYAVFRLIIDDGLPLIFNTSVDLQKVYARKVAHTTVKSICEALSKPTFDKNSNLVKFDSLFKNKAPFEVRDDIKILAKLFCELHNERESADYDTLIHFKVEKDPLAMVKQMEKFFATWDQLKINDRESLTTLLGVFLLGTEKLRNN